jgi:hypothetical protein
MAKTEREKVLVYNVNSSRRERERVGRVRVKRRTRKRRERKATLFLVVRERGMMLYI